VHGADVEEAGWWERLPFAGPEGWAALDDDWADFIADVQKIVRTAGLLGWAKAEGHDVVGDEAFNLIAATIAIVGTGENKGLWALLSAAVFNEATDLRLLDRETRGLWSPADCRDKLPWERLRRQLEKPSPLYEQLVKSATPASFARARAYCEAAWTLVSATAALFSPSDDQTAELAAFRLMLLRCLPSGGRSTSTGRVREGTPPAGAPSGDPGQAADSALLQLDDLVGLETVKQEIALLASFMSIERMRERHGWKNPPVTRHMVMLGNPGTGKTTVAKRLGEIYHAYGILARSEVKALSRAELIGKFVGHTAPQLRDEFMAARGGIFFLDEAYSLLRTDGGGQDFGHEAVAQLIVLMEEHRDDTIVIAAGYPGPMREFLKSNDGLASRFGQTINFPDYDDEEMMKIVRGMADGAYVISGAAERELARLFPEVRKLLGDRFANARTARNILGEGSKLQHARVYDDAKREHRDPTKEELGELRDVDVPTAEAVVGAIGAQDQKLTPD
jgi:AAA+ superfamily predicted ATPase